MIVAAAIAIWTICGIFSYGCQFAYWQREWPTLAREDVATDRRISLFSAIFGPMSLIFQLIFGEWHGIMFFPERECSLDSFILSPNGDET